MTDAARRACRTRSCRCPGPRHGAPAPARPGRRWDRRRPGRRRTGSSANAPTASRSSSTYPGASTCGDRRRRASRDDLDLSIELARLRRVHAADRQARPGPGPRVGRVRAADRRHHDHVLPAAPAGLDPAGTGRPARRSSGARTATSTSSASSAGCSTSSSRLAQRPDRRPGDGSGSAGPRDSHLGAPVVHDARTNVR